MCISAIEPSSVILSQTRWFKSWKEMSKNSETPSTSKVWPSDHRQDDRSSAWPLYIIAQNFPKALYSDKGGGDYMTGLVQNPLWGDKALILVPSDCKSGFLQSFDLSSLPDGRSIAYSARCLHIFLRYCSITLHLCAIMFMASPLRLALGPRSL